MDTTAKKLISVVVPVYNEEPMINEIYNRTVRVMDSMRSYDFELVFFDDCSTDNSRKLISGLCKKDSRVKAVFYKKNIGYSKNIFYCVQQAKGDCAVLMHADLQNPPEEIPNLVKKWEQGYKFVGGIKDKSKENKVMFFLRTVFYFIMNLVFAMNLVPHATDYGLFDKDFIETLKHSVYRNPFLRSLIQDNISKDKIAFIHYIQDRRNAGKTKFNISKYYDFAICGIVNGSKKLPRRFIVVGIISFIISVLELIFNYIPDCLNHRIESPCTPLIVRGLFVLMSLIIILVSIIFEYIIAIHNKLDEKPFVFESERINY